MRPQPGKRGRSAAAGRADPAGRGGLLCQVGPCCPCLCGPGPWVIALGRGLRTRSACGRVKSGLRIALPRDRGRTLQLMWAVESPNVGPSLSGHSTEPAAKAPPDSLLRSSPCAPSSLCSSPGSVLPDSLQTLPGRGSPCESPSIQCDSLECPCSCWSVGSVGVYEDSLQAPLAVGNGRGCFRAHHSKPQASSDLSDSLESFGAQHDSLQSVSSLSESFRSSSISGDSLESLSSLGSKSTSQHSSLEVISQ